MKNLRKLLSMMLLSMLCLSMLPSVLAVHTETEDFDTDVLNHNPSEPWYTLKTYQGGPLVTNNDSVSAPNCLEGHKFSVGGWSTFTLVDWISTQTSLTEIDFDYKGINVISNMMLFDIPELGCRIQTIDNLTDFNLRWYDGFSASWVYDNYSHYAYNTWYHFQILVDTNAGLWAFATDVESYPCAKYVNSFELHYHSFKLRTARWGTAFEYIDNVEWTHPNSPPYATLNSPLDGAWEIPLDPMYSSLNVTVHDLEHDVINVTFHLAYMDQMVAGTWRWIANSTWIGYADGESLALPIVYLNPDRLCHQLYGWWVTVTDVDGSGYYPQYSGAGYNTTLDNRAVGIPDRLWTFTPVNVSLPTITINTPTAAPKTVASWRAGHRLNVSISGNDYPIGLYLQVTMASGTNSFFLDTIDANGTYSYDLAPYVPFDNYRYNIRLEGDVWACGWTALVYHNYSSTINFTIGTPGIIQRRFAVWLCSPADGDKNALSALVSGVRFRHTTDTFTEQACLWYFLQDVTDGNIAGSKYLVYSYLPHTSVDFTGSDWWINFYPSQFIQERHHYIFYVGILKKAYAPYVSFPSTITDWSGLYDDSMVYIQNFSIHSVIGADLSHILSGLSSFTVDYFITEDASGPAQFEGVRAEFWTYPIGETPFADSTGWKNTNWAAANVDNQGIPWLGIIMGCFVVGIFSIAPFMLAKKKRVRNVPMPIQMTFTLFGFFLAFGMGLFPLWIFIPPTILVLVIIFYKGVNWAKKSRNEMNAEKEQ